MLIRTDQSNVGKIPKGVLVDEVRPRSPADRAGLRPGELITHVNRQQINNPASYKEAIDRAAPGPSNLPSARRHQNRPQGCPAMRMP